MDTREREKKGPRDCKGVLMVFSFSCFTPPPSLLSSLVATCSCSSSSSSSSRFPPFPAKKKPLRHHVQLREERLQRQQCGPPRAPPPRRGGLARPADSAQLIKIQENVSYRLFISSELSLFVSMGLFESLNSESGRLGADGALQRGRG